MPSRRQSATRWRRSVRASCLIRRRLPGSPGETPAGDRPGRIPDPRRRGAHEPDAPVPAAASGVTARRVPGPAIAAMAAVIELPCLSGSRTPKYNLRTFCAPDIAHRMTPSETLILVSYFFVLSILAVYGWHRYYLVYLYMRHKDSQPVEPVVRWTRCPWSRCSSRSTTKCTWRTG